MRFVGRGLSLEGQMEQHVARLMWQSEQDADFRRWLETEYTPIAGGWQY